MSRATLADAPVDTACTQPERDVVEHAQVREQSVVLEDEADSPCFWRQMRSGRRVVEHDPVDLDASRFDGDEPRNHAKQRRLAGTIRSQHGDGDTGIGRDVAVEVQRADARAHVGPQRHRSAPSQRSRRTTSTTIEIVSSTSDSVIAVPTLPDPSNEL